MKRDQEPRDITGRAFNSNQGIGEDIQTWEHVTHAIDVLMTRTRAEGWTVEITVAEVEIPREEGGM